MLTVPADQDEIMTKTAVPIIVDWTAQIRPDRRAQAQLETAIISFKERGKDGIIDDVRLTLMGAVRDVVASMTPEKVLADKEVFKKNVQESVEDEMNKMGLELVSLNIQDITDRNGYFDNIAFLDKSEKQKAADIKAKKLAEADGERALAEARAANEKVNFEIEKLKIQTDAQIKVATSTAEIMANIGQNAEFVNIGGGNLSSHGGSGNALIDTIMSIPAIMKVLNAENQALNGQSTTEEIKGISDATLSGLGVLKKSLEEAEKS